MTSGDTHNRTLAFLKENSYFGAKPSQVTLIKQEKVSSAVFDLFFMGCSHEPRIAWTAQGTQILR